MNVHSRNLLYEISCISLSQFKELKFTSTTLPKRSWKNWGMQVKNLDCHLDNAVIRSVSPTPLFLLVIGYRGEEALLWSFKGANHQSFENIKKCISGGVGAGATVPAPRDGGHHVCLPHLRL